MKPMQDLERLVAEKPQQKDTSKYVVAFILGMLGALVSGYGGYVFQTGLFFYEHGQGAGVVPIIAAVGGFVIFFGIGLCALGPGEQVYSKLFAVMPPGMERFEVTGLSSFDLYVTVHRIKNRYNSDPCTKMFHGLSSPYVEVVVGRYVDNDRQLSVQRNPPKRTCLSTSNTFEECFHFVVSPTDDTIRFSVYDQDVMANDLIGKCDVNIMDEVLAAGFPQKKAFKLEREDVLAAKSADRDTDRHAGSVIVSFTPGANFPESALPALRKKDDFAVQRMRSITGKLRSEAERSASQYGAMVTGVSYAA